MEAKIWDFWGGGEMKIISIILLVIVLVIGRIVSSVHIDNKYIRFGRLAVVAMVVAMLVLCFWEEGTVHNGNIHISEQRMKIKFLKADREFTDRMKLRADKKLDIKAKCSSGCLLLTIYQNQKEVTYDISNWDKELVLEEFQEGYVNLHLKNEKARDVNVDITCE